MGLTIESEDGKSQLEIGEFTTDAGREYVSLRRLYKTRDGKFYPHKFKSGCPNMIYLSKDEWKGLVTRLQQYFGAQDEYTPPEPSADEF